MSYGTDHVDVYRRAAAYVDRILKRREAGRSAGPTPTKFELIINLKTAKALGLDVPSFAARTRRRGDRMSAPGKAGAIQPVEVRPK